MGSQTNQIKILNIYNRKYVESSQQKMVQEIIQAVQDSNMLFLGYAIFRSKMSHFLKIPKVYQIQGKKFKWIKKSAKYYTKLRKVMCKNYAYLALRELNWEGSR